MIDISSAIKTAKETSAYVAMSVGAGMTMGQFVGVLIGVGGLIVGILRCRVAMQQQKEVKRANDFNREKWEYEKNAKSKDLQKAKS